MSNTQRFNERGKRKRALTVEELEEVEIVDRRGNVRVDFQPVKQQPTSNPPTPRRQPKRPYQKSLSPTAAGSHQSPRKPRTTKV
jgi:hypothetical protein